VCGCNGGSSASAGGQYVITFADGSRSAPYPDETSARVALARSGKTGSVKAAPKAA
jgi:hypothetical protein